MLLNPYADISAHAPTSRFPTTSGPSGSIDVDPMNSIAVDTLDTSGTFAEPNEHRVLKVIRKAEVQLLCTQHNPVRNS